MTLPSVVIADELTKVLPFQQPAPARLERTFFTNEELCFQVAWKTDSVECGQTFIDISVETASDAQVSFRDVLLVPASTPYFVGDEDGYLTDHPTLIPDLLRPLPHQKSQTSADARTLWQTRTHQHHRGWNSVWVAVSHPSEDVTVVVNHHDMEISRTRLAITTIDSPLPRPDLVNTRWFHCDSLARHYEVDVWSEEHWDIIDQHMAAARRMEVSSLLMPLWTPPLDTAPGTHRLPTQLLDIHKDASGHYHFGTDKVMRWIDLMKKNGITHVEVPHFFTQWGASACARFLIHTADSPGNNPHPFFGWDTPATSNDYRAFLEELIPFLRQFLSAHMDPGNILFHVSDEPAADTLESYSAARGRVIDLLDGCNVLDALSEVDYTNLVSTPIVATHAIAQFRQAGIEPKWVYYCVCQETRLANQFIAQRPNRHRQLGFQLYKSRARGFLQWGYNFYNLQLSTGQANPYWENDAGGGFISGDPFIVYPAPDRRVWESLRHRMVGDAFRDLSACQYAESLIGREAVLSIIDPNRDLDYNSGWASENELIGRREALNSAIFTALQDRRKEHS